MSAAAEAAASLTIGRLKLKGSRYALVKTLATLIPEGETMTAPISIEDLAARAGYYDQAIRQARDDLVELHALRIIGGGRGRLGSYELLDLPGAGQHDPTLPLIGRVRPRPSRAAEPDLFDAPTVGHTRAAADDSRVYDIGDFHRRWWLKVGDFHRRCLAYVGDFHRRLRTRVYDIGDFHRRWRANIGDFHRPLPPVVDVASRARGSTYTQEDHVHTHTAPARPGAAEPPPSPRPPHPWHAWCDGRVHVPRKLHEEFVAKLRLPDAELFAIYRAENAALVPTAPILDKDEYAFWRQRFAQRFARDNRAPPSPATPAPWCQEHDPPCTRWTEHRDRVLTDARAERARDRKSG
jgi:hypothetical protein